MTYDFDADEFSVQQVGGARISPEAPLSAGWLVVAPCNLKCIHCYGNVEELPSSKPSTSDQLKVADKIIESGIMRQILSGREPLLRKDTFESIEKLTAHDISVILGTNGSYLTQSSVRFLSKVTRVEISLDSHLESVNNAIRPARNTFGNAYQETLKAIRLCVQNGVRLRNFYLFKQDKFSSGCSIG